MRLPRMRHLPGRLATGAFVLNAGLDIREADEETVATLHGMAKDAYPFVADLDPKEFVSLLSTAEIVLGAALLLPFVPTGVAGAALTAFSAGLVGMYARTPGMRKEGSVFPTDQGLTLAKDVWMLAIGLGFVIDELMDRD